MMEKVVKFACPYCNQDFETLSTLEEFDSLSALQAHLETVHPPKVQSMPVWGREEWEVAKKKHYLETLKLSERGLPPREELQRLGLEFVIPVLEPMDALG